MPTIRPLEAYLAHPERAAEIVAPAYDALSPDSRRRFAEAHPNNYLNVLRSRADFPEGEGPGAEELLRRNAARLREMMREGLLVYNPSAGFYIYRLAVADHAQVGLVAEVPVEAYEQGLVKKHEETQQDKEDQLARYLEVVRASSSPICLAYQERPEIERLLAECTQAEPVVDFISDDGVHQTLWFVDHPEVIDALSRLFAEVPAFYLTDGHHRSAAASRFAASERARNPQHTGEEPYNHLLVALFPEHQLRILDYNRCVSSLNGHSAERLLGDLEEVFEVEALRVDSPEAARPARRREMAMCLRGRWYRLRVRPERVAQDDPVRALDLMVLHEQVLHPKLGIAEPRADPRIDYIPGPLGMAGLAERCQQGWDVAFAVYPTAIDELRAVADTGGAMPPKSTWFDPKVRSGTLVRLR